MTPRPASPGELARARILFLEALSGAVDPETWTAEGSPSACSSGTARRTWRWPERPAHRRGRGFFVIRRGDRSGRVIEAPHAHDDVGTGAIALSLLRAGGTAAALGTGRRGDLDPAHDDRTWHQAFTLAAAQTWPRGIVVQTHGFAREKRSSPSGAMADVIVSTGSRNPGPWAAEVVRCLREEASLEGAVLPP